MVDERWIRQSRWVMYLFYTTLLVIYHIGYVWNGGDDIHVELTVEALLNDLHVEQSEESAAESESQRQRTLRLECQRRVVQLEFLQRRAQVFVLVGFDGIDAREDHRLHVLESGDRFPRGVRHRRNRVADLHVRRGLDA